MKGPRAEVATAGLIFTPPAAGRLCVQGQRVYVCRGPTNLTRVSGAPSKIPQPATDKLKQTSCPEGIDLFLLT